MFVQFFLIPSEKSELSRKKESLLKKTKEKKANREQIKMVDDKIKLSV